MELTHGKAKSNHMCICLTTKSRNCCSSCSFSFMKNSHKARSDSFSSCTCTCVSTCSRRCACTRAPRISYAGGREPSRSQERRLQQSGGTRAQRLCSGRVRPCPGRRDPQRPHIRPMRHRHRRGTGCAAAPSHSSQRRTVWRRSSCEQPCNWHAALCGVEAAARRAVYVVWQVCVECFKNRTGGTV